MLSAAILFGALYFDKLLHCTNTDKTILKHYFVLSQKCC